MTGGTVGAHIVIERPGFRLDARLQLDRADVLAVMGPSGAGKSSLLAAIAGLTPVHAGHVRIDGVDVGGQRPRPPHRRGVVLLRQDARLFPHLSVRDNIAFGLRAHGAPRQAARDGAVQWLSRVGLEGFGARRPHELSGGQQQRVALARALATSPRLLLLDEPLTALDPETAGDIRSLLADQLQAEGVTAIVVTHDALDAASLAQRLLILEAGRVSQEGAVREVLAMPSTSFAAAAAGTNRLRGTASRGACLVRAGEGSVALQAEDPASRAAAAQEGTPLAAFIRPGQVVLEPDAGRSDETSAAGEWRTTIVRLEQTPGGVRVHTAEPALSAEVPADAVAAWGLAPGQPVRVRIPAHAVRFAPAG